MTKDSGHLLVIFFNLDFSKNIPRLLSIYEKRFSNIVFVVPDHYSYLDKYYFTPYAGVKNEGLGGSFTVVNFLDGGYNKLRAAANALWGKTPAGRGEDIVRVCGHKYYFQDFFWQSQKKINYSNYDWCWFLSDDVLLHPDINEENILEVLGSRANTKSFVAEPHFARDAWANYFMGSAEDAAEILSAASLDYKPENPNEIDIAPYQEGESQRRLLCGCADFFGLHGSIINPALHNFHALAKQKIFVEVAIPNTILSMDKNCTTFTNYQFDFEEDRGCMAKVSAFLSSADLFYHPVKFSEMADSQLVSLGLSTTK